MNELVQLNVRVPRRLAEKIREDAIRNGRTLEAVAGSILADFFSSWGLSERANYYNKARPKTVGRKLKV